MIDCSKSHTTVFGLHLWPDVCLTSLFMTCRTSRWWPVLFPDIRAVANGRTLPLYLPWNIARTAMDTFERYHPYRHHGSDITSSNFRPFQIPQYPSRCPNEGDISHWTKWWPILPQSSHLHILEVSVEGGPVLFVVKLFSQYGTLEVDPCHPHLADSSHDICLFNWSWCIIKNGLLELFSCHVALDLGIVLTMTMMCMICNEFYVWVILVKIKYIGF